VEGYQKEQLHQSCRSPDYIQIIYISIRIIYISL